MADRDAAEEKGHMDVMKDIATPLPVLVIAQMMGVPKEDRPYVRYLAEKLLYIGRGEYDRMKSLTEGMQGMIEYVSPLVDERIVNPEGQEVFKALAERFPSLHVETEELAYQPSIAFRSLTSLPVAW
jgi:unspecific monooxygenase